MLRIELNILDIILKVRGIIIKNIVKTPSDVDEYQIYSGFGVKYFIPNHVNDSEQLRESIANTIILECMNLEINGLSTIFKDIRDFSKTTYQFEHNQEINLCIGFINQIQTYKSRNFTNPKELVDFLSDSFNNFISEWIETNK